MYAPATSAERSPEGIRGSTEQRLGGLRVLALTHPLLWPTLLIALVLCVVAFITKGGLSLETLEAKQTTVEMALTIGSGLAVAAAVVFAPADRRTYGMWTIGLLLAFTALSAVSVVWSVQPDDSWQDTGRLLAYSGVFAAAATLARAVPDRWPAVIGGVLLSTVVLCGYALLTKVLPNELGADYVYARLQEPFGYWNATGLTAAMGMVGCMWLGARRSGHALLSALAYPLMGIMIVTLMLAYSRGALAAAALGLALWFCIVPLRLRGAAVLIAGALGAAPVVAWVFANATLSTDNVALAQRVPAGHQLGVLLAAMLLVLGCVGVSASFLSGRRAPSRSSRQRAGVILLSILALAVLAFAGKLAMSQRGFTGSITHGVNALTDPHAPVPANSPSRLGAIGSVRARYWNEALKVFKDHEALGAGAAGYATAHLRYRTETLNVHHAHGYIVQTLADLGLVGLAVTLALLSAWLTAAGRSTHPFNRRWTRWQWRREAHPYTAERIGMLSMLSLVVVFGIHSFADWTWYVPGDACVALLCAGWLAGRGPLANAPASTPATSTTLATSTAGAGANRLRLLVAAVVVVAALLAAWAQWQPQRSVQASEQALALAANDPKGALAAAQTAVSRDPLSAQALLTLSAIQQHLGQAGTARDTLQRAVRLQPSNPQTWVALGEYDLAANEPQMALQDLRAAIYLNPEAVAPETVTAGEPDLIAIRNDYLQALRATSTSTSASAGSTSTGSTSVPLKPTPTP
jgi:O-Antigen ligase